MHAALPSGHVCVQHFEYWVPSCCNYNIISRYLPGQAHTNIEEHKLQWLVSSMCHILIFSFTCVFGITNLATEVNS